jgi:hypothetical protein
VSRLAPAVLAILFGLVSLVPAVSAQENPRWKTLSVSIWPEYDQPSVFVNYEGELAENVALPATVNMVLPKGFQVNSACEIDANGQHTVVNHTENTGDNPGVSYPTGKKNTHIEFYFNPIEGAGKRDLSYKFVAPGAVDSLVIDVQQPLRANGFAVTPAAKQTLSDKQGFKYHRFEYSNVTAGQTITFNMSYEKADAKPSVEPQQATSGSTATASAGGEYALPLVLLGLGFVGLAAFFFMRPRGRSQRRVAYAASGGQAPRRKGAVVSPRAANAPVAPAVTQTSAGFCTKCGTRLRAGAAFCSSCGQPAKRRAT